MGDRDESARLHLYRTATVWCKCVLYRRREHDIETLPNSRVAWERTKNESWLLATAADGKHAEKKA